MELENLMSKQQAEQPMRDWQNQLEIEREETELRRRKKELQQQHY